MAMIVGIPHVETNPYDTNFLWAEKTHWHECAYLELGGWTEDLIKHGIHQPRVPQLHINNSADGLKAGHTWGSLGYKRG